MLQCHHHKMRAQKFDSVQVRMNKQKIKYPPQQFQGQNNRSQELPFRPKSTLAEIEEEVCHFAMSLGFGAAYGCAVSGTSFGKLESDRQSRSAAYFHMAKLISQLRHGEKDDAPPTFLVEGEATILPSSLSRTTNTSAVSPFNSTGASNEAAEPSHC